MSYEKPKAGKLPEYDLACLHKQTGKKGQVGAGWINDDGSISVVLNIGVVVNGNGDFQLRLFKRDASGRRATIPVVEKQVEQDDMPF